METWREDARPEHTHDPNEVTVQIDGVGRHLADLVPDPVDGAADGPVFVDATGRRGRRYRRIGMFVGLLCAVYAVAIVATLLSGNSSAPWVPIQAPEDGRPASKVDTPGRPADGPAPSPSSATSPSPAATDGGGAAPGPADPEAPGPARGGEGAGTPGTVPGSDPADGGSEPDPGPGSFGGDAPGPDPSGDGGGAADPTDPAEQPSDPPTSAEPGGTAGADGGEVPVAYTTPDRRQPADQPPPEAAQR
ncbi:hypothetical protein [Streptomyces sp. A1499]|uniref:hypothetical protein n=1 Tax=Streptomyces sp. A1499 TaxID=2563104 RepID=UPI00109E95B1|nr:hypothetical protein [Streptomyces sp. A1499]THC47565.1 hypothetical protein E7X58_27270 [Streptomyces sp. A1499]